MGMVFTTQEPMTNTTTADRPYTLAAIAAAQGAIKRTAQLWLAKAKRDHGDIGEVIGGARHFSEAERNILTSYAAPPKPAKVEAEPPRVVQVEAFPGFGGSAVYEPPAPLDIEIVAGNHRLTLDGPEMGAAIDLAQFRGELEVKSYQDPLAAIEAANAMIDAAENAMVEDLSERVRLLQQTQQATAKLTQRAEELKTQQIEYRVKQDLLGLIQNQETAKLGELLGKAEALGGGGGQ